MSTSTPIQCSPQEMIGHIERHLDCGICGGKDGFEVIWVTSETFGAHKNCYAKIALIEQILTLAIGETFYVWDKDKAYRKVVNAIRMHLGKTPIGEYLDTHGSDQLEKLIRRVGIPAAFTLNSADLPDRRFVRSRSKTTSFL